MTKVVHDSFSANTLSSPNKEIGWREFFILLIYAVGLTTAIYVLRQHLKQLPSLSDSQQISMLATTEFTGTVAPSKEFKIAATTPRVSASQRLLTSGFRSIIMLGEASSKNS